MQKSNHFLGFDFYKTCRIYLKDIEGVTETLKAENQMKWVGLMNNIADRAREIVNTEIIYC